MKIFPKLRMTARKGLVLTALVAAFVGGGIVYNTAVQADVTFPATTADCDSNAVIRCGVTSTGSIKSHYAADGSVRNIYSGFGISSSEISSMGTYAVAGYVTNTNYVYVNGNSSPVASSAVTAGRQYISGSTKVVTNGTTYYKRAPSVSFRSKSLAAFVVMKNGVFQYAIIASCGNPVSATAKKPNYSITKYVAAGQSGFVKAVTTSPNSRVEYAVNVKSTGQIAALNVMAKDVLPAHVTYVPGTLTRDGVKVSNDGDFFKAGVKIASLAPGVTTQFKFAAVVDATSNSETCVNGTLVNVSSISSPELPTLSDTANVSEVCGPRPAYVCTQLHAARVGETNEFTFNTTASATNGAQIVSYTYNYGEGAAVTTASSTSNHTYSAPGTYNASVIVNVTVNGRTVAVTSNSCKATVTIPQPPTPVYTCNKLTATQVSRDAFTYTTAATATNGATITSYVYNFGDNTAPVTGASTTSHTYANPGTYTTTATVNFTVNGVAKTATSPACQTKVTVSPQPFAQCTNVTATIGDNRAVTVNATYIAQNGATLNTVSFDFGDSTAPVTGTSTTANHTYAADGSYTIKATMTFNGATATPNENCKAVVSFNTPQPVYTCDKFTITQGDNRTVTVSDFQTTATNGAVFKSADINWGDNTSDKDIATVVGKTHQYGQDGTFVITALAHFTVNGQDVTAGGAHCTQTVTYTTPTPPVTPPTPTPTPPAVLVNTGAGSTAGLFALATIGGTFAYRWFLARRLNQN